MKGDNVAESVDEESRGMDQQQLLSAETLMDITNARPNKENASDRGGNNSALQPALSLPKITHSNWTVSGNGKADNDIPGKWFLTPDEEVKKQKKTNKTASIPRDPDVKRSNKVSNGYGVGLPRKNDNGLKVIVEEDLIDYTNRYIEMSKYLRLKKKLDETQERLANNTDMIKKWHEVADKQNHSPMQREGLPPSETFNVERNEKRDMEIMDMWKGKALDYKAKYHNACKQLKMFKSEYDQAKRIEREVNNWIVKAKDYRIKYRDLSKEYDDLMIRYKEQAKEKYFKLDQ